MAILLKLSTALSQFEKMLLYRKLFLIMLFSSTRFDLEIFDVVLRLSAWAERLGFHPAYRHRQLQPWGLFTAIDEWINGDSHGGKGSNESVRKEVVIPEVVNDNVVSSWGFWSCEFVFGLQNSIWAEGTDFKRSVKIIVDDKPWRRSLTINMGKIEIWLNDPGTNAAEQCILPRCKYDPHW